MVQRCSILLNILVEYAFQSRLFIVLQNMTRASSKNYLLVFQQTMNRWDQKCSFYQKYKPNRTAIDRSILLVIVANMLTANDLVKDQTNRMVQRCSILFKILVERGCQSHLFIVYQKMTSASSNNYLLVFQQTMNRCDQNAHSTKNINQIGQQQTILFFQSLQLIC